MNRREQERLLREILAGDELSALRQNSLQQGLLQLHRARRQAKVLRASGWTALAIISILLVFARSVPVRPTRPAGPGIISAQSSKRPQGPAVRYITDDELLGLFPDRPVALIGKPGQQQLVFLDELAAANRAKAF